MGGRAGGDAEGRGWSGGGGSAEYDEPSVSGLLPMSRRWITANMPDYAAVDIAEIKYL